MRDWASGTGWDKKPPAPAIPDDVVAGTRAKYVEAYEKITGESFDAGSLGWPRSARAGPGPAEGRHPRPAGRRRGARPAGAGFEGVANVHVGRLIELDVEDPSQLVAMCEKLLVNPLIEDYEILEDA